MTKIPASLIVSYLYSEYQPKKVNGSNELRINSPFIEDTKFHCYINPDESVYTDFKAGGGGSGSMYDFFKEILGLKSFSSIISYLIKNYGTTEQKQKFEENKVVDTSEIITSFIKNDKPKFFKDEKELGVFGKMCLRYLQNRKMSEEYISRMGYVFNDTSRYNGRIIIPYFENGSFVYFQARDINKESSLRYLNPEKLDTKEFVFNIDDITDELIIAEGPFDAMSMDEQTATCMDSGDLGEKQIMKIFSKKPNTIIYCPDQDETGARKMDKNIENLYRLCPYTESLKIYIFNVPKPYKDLNEMKVGNGKNFILKKECEPYKKKVFRDFDFSKECSV